MQFVQQVNFHEIINFSQFTKLDHSNMVMSAY